MATPPSRWLSIRPDGGRRNGQAPLRAPAPVRRRPDGPAGSGCAGGTRSECRSNRDLARQHERIAPGVGIEHRHRGQQRAHVGMGRMAEQLGGVPPSSTIDAEIHDGHPRGEIAHRREVVRDEQVGGRGAGAAPPAAGSPGRPQRTSSAEVGSSSTIRRRLVTRARAMLTLAGAGRPTARADSGRRDRHRGRPPRAPRRFAGAARRRSSACAA